MLLRTLEIKNFCVLWDRNADNSTFVALGPSESGILCQKSG